MALTFSFYALCVASEILNLIRAIGLLVNLLMLEELLCWLKSLYGRDLLRVDHEAWKFLCIDLLPLVLPVV